MIARAVLIGGEMGVVLCDARCEKAWGIDTRPRRQLSDLEDDFEYLSDLELGIAPVNPGTSEGGCFKPRTKESRLNKWCARECERSYIVYPGEEGEDFELEDFSKPRPNILSLHTDQSKTNYIPALCPNEKEVAPK